MLPSAWKFLFLFVGPFLRWTFSSSLNPSCARWKRNYAHFFVFLLEVLPFVLKFFVFNRNVPFAVTVLFVSGPCCFRCRSTSFFVRTIAVFDCGKWENGENAKTNPRHIRLSGPYVLSSFSIFLFSCDFHKFHNDVWAQPNAKTIIHFSCAFFCARAGSSLWKGCVYACIFFIFQMFRHVFRNMVWVISYKYFETRHLHATGTISVWIADPLSQLQYRMAIKTRCLKLAGIRNKAV